MTLTVKLATPGAADGAIFRGAACGAGGPEFGRIVLSKTGRGEAQLTGTNLEGYRRSSVEILNNEVVVSCSEVPDG